MKSNETLEREIQALTQALGRKPTNEEIMAFAEHDKVLLDAIKEELRKCQDPVYMYENHWTNADGSKPPPLTDLDKQMMRGEITHAEYLRLKHGIK